MTHRTIVAAVLGFVATMAILIAIAPKPQHRRASAAIVPRSVCAGFGGTRSATLTSSVAGTVAAQVYSVTCQDGVQLDWSRP